MKQPCLKEKTEPTKILEEERGTEYERASKRELVFLGSAESNICQGAGVEHVIQSLDILM